MDSILSFQIHLDERARTWLRADKSTVPLVIGYLETRCCGGGRICDVRVRSSRRAERWPLVRIGSVAGRDLLLDRRIVGRLPRRLPMTVRGFGPFQALSLDLEGEEWGRLLFD